MPSRFAPSVDMGPCQHRPYQMARFCKGGLLLLPASSATCCCCCSLLLLVAAAAGGAGVARGFTHALQNTRAYPQTEATFSQTCKKQEVWYAALSGEVWAFQSVRKVFGQQEAAVEPNIDQIWLYHNMLPPYDLLTHIKSKLLRVCD